MDWESLLTGEGLDGWQSGGPSFTRTGDVVRGVDGAGWGDHLFTGRDDWADYEIAVAITLHSGVMAQVHFRIDPARGHRCWHTLDLRADEQAVTLGTADNGPGGFGLRKDVSRLFPVELARAYEVRIAARGATATATVDDVPIGELALAHPTGRVGFGIWQVDASFEAPRVRLL